MLTLNLQPIFKINGIDNPFTFLVKAGFPRHSATLLVNSAKNSIRFDHIEKLCLLFRCEPNDLLVWVPGKQVADPQSQPLQKLVQRATVPDLKQSLAAMSYEQLKQVAAGIQKQSSEK